MKEVHQNEKDASVVGETLEEMVREGARRMLAAALEEEVSTFLGRDRYERGEEFRGYRNGYHPSRELTVGVLAVEVKAPRVSDVPAEVSPAGFESKIVKRYERTSRQTQDQSPDAGPVSEAVPGGLVYRGLRAGVSGVCGGDGSAES